MIQIASLYTFILVLVRMTAFLVTAPVFSSKGVPAHFKIGLGLFLSILVVPTVGINLDLAINSFFIFLLIQETIIGLALGWLAQVVFSSIHVAGAFIDMQVGFSLANVIDPQTGVQTPLIGSFKYIFAILLFLALDMHHLFIDGIIASYQYLPIQGEWFSQLGSESAAFFVLATFSKMFFIAFKIAVPIVITLLLSDIALGIIARTVPQFNVFVIGLPLKVLINFILLFIIASGFLYMFKDLFEDMILTLKQFMQLMGL